MSGAESVDPDALAYVESSKYRVAVVEHLSRGRATSAEIARAEGFFQSSISRALGECKDEGVVELLVSENTHLNRYYGLTELGEAVAAEIGDDGDGEGESDG